MNILLTNSTDIFAGGEDYVLILARYLRLRGHQVCVSALPGHLLLQKCARADIETLPINYTGMSHLFSVAALLRRELRGRKIDILHSNANYDRTTAAIATAALDVPHVAGVHSAHSIQHNITHWLRNRFGIDHFIADADAVRTVLIEQDHIPEARITVVPIGVESQDEGLRAEAREEMRAELEIDDRTVLIGNVARLVPFKGHSVLLRSAARVLRSRKDVLFVVAGDGELHEELQEQAHTLGIERHLRFLGFRDDLDRLYPAFDIYCHSSLELAAEAFPLAILRALAAGLPVASTRVGGIPLMVEEGQTGFLTPPDDPDALGDALLKLIASPPLRTSMGKESLALFARKFHAATMAETVEGLYKRLLTH